MLLRDSVALRKESVDRNIKNKSSFQHRAESLSVRRAWIEISVCFNVVIQSVRRSP